MNAKWMVLVGLTAVLAMGADPLPDTVAAYRARYEALKGKLDAKRDGAIAKAVGAYRGELQALLANVRQQGDLDYVVAIQGELKRLETDPTAPQKPAEKRMKHLRRAQGGVKVAEDQALEAHGEGLARLTKGYADTLEKLEKRLVAANEIAEAKRAREERIQVAELIPEPEEKGEVDVVGKPAKKLITTTIEALIDGDTYLVISDEGIQWSCRLNVELVGKTGHKSRKATRINGKAWHPKWGKPIREHNIRKSDVYPIEGLAGPVSVTVLAKREGAKPETYTKRLIYIRDREPGASWYVITITHEG